ncbi:BrnA antitoxin family protein [Glaciimonas sp. GG7]
MNAKLPQSATVWTDPDDAPEITDEWVAQADLYQGKKLIRRGRPLAEVTKESVTIRMTPTTVDRFRATGKGWQTRMDAALVDWLKEHSPEEINI